MKIKELFLKYGLANFQKNMVEPMFICQFKKTLSYVKYVTKPKIYFSKFLIISKSLFLIWNGC